MQPLSKYSRFHSTPLVLDDQDVTRFIEWKPPFYGEVSEFIYVVNARDLDRPDIISYRLFGTVELWWMVLHYNKITDPFTLEVGQKLKIPSPEGIKRGLDSKSSTSKLRTSIPSSQVKLTKVTRKTIKPFKRPPITSDAGDDASTLFVFNFAFPVPSGLTGQTHFQIQISDKADFSTVLSSVMTQTSVERWFYYDPTSSNGTGGFISFPTNGINGSAYASQTVYYKVAEGDLRLASVSEYFFRYRSWINNIEGTWTASPPLILA